MSGNRSETVGLPHEKRVLARFLDLHVGAIEQSFPTRPTIFVTIFQGPERRLITETGQSRTRQRDR